MCVCVFWLANNTQPSNLLFVILFIWCAFDYLIINNIDYRKEKRFICLCDLFAFNLIALKDDGWLKNETKEIIID